MHHRESSAGVWGRWWMDRRQNCCDESALDMPRSPAFLYPAQSVGCGRQGVFPAQSVGCGRQGSFPEHLPFFGPGGRGRRFARGKGRQVIVAGLLRTRRSNIGGDPSTTGLKRQPNSRDGARCDAAFQKEEWSLESQTEQSKPAPRADARRVHTRDDT